MQESEQFTEYDFALEHTPASESELSPESRLIVALQDCGCDIQESPKVFAAIEPVLDEIADRRAGEAMRRILCLLDGTAAGLALRRVICGDATPLREAAKAAGASHVAIHLQEKTIRKRLGLTSPPLIEK